MEEDAVVVRKSVGIAGVVVTAENVRELVGRLSREESPDPASRSEDRLKFTLRGADGTQYDTREVGFLDKGGVLETRRIVSIEMSFDNYGEDRRLSISLRHGAGAYASDNSARVSGRDETWVNGSVQWVQDCVSNWKKQAMWPRRQQFVLFPAVMVVLGGGVVMLLGFIVGILNGSVEVRRGLSFVAGVLVVLAGSVSLYVVAWLQNLYPEVEFAMGPEHQQMEKGRRKKLYLVVGSIFAPLLVGLVLLVLGWIVG